MYRVCKREAGCVLYNGYFYIGQSTDSRLLAAWVRDGGSGSPLHCTMTCQGGNLSLPPTIIESWIQGGERRDSPSSLHHRIAGFFNDVRAGLSPHFPSPHRVLRQGPGILIDPGPKAPKRAGLLGESPGMWARAQGSFGQFPYIGVYTPEIHVGGLCPVASLRPTV